MNFSTNSINWFEIPVMDMQRAKHFYQTIFSIHMEDQDMSGMPMALFPYKPGSGLVGGALVKSEMHNPNEGGIIIYLNANPSIQLVLDKIESEGATVVLQKTLISEDIGYMAFFIDTEGNKVGLHASQ